MRAVTETTALTKRYGRSETAGATPAKEEDGCNRSPPVRKATLLQAILSINDKLSVKTISMWTVLGGTMIFTKLISIAAWIVLVGSAIRILTGLGIATEFLGPYEEALRRYGGTAANSGAMIDRGVYGFIAALVLGTLGEISKRKEK